MDTPCFELKGSLFTLSVLQLFENNLPILKEQLQKRVQMAPGFFNHTPFVVDLNELSDDKHDLDFVALKELLISFSIIPVGVKGADTSVIPKLEAAGLPILAEAKTSHKKDTALQQAVKQAEPIPETEAQKPEPPKPEPEAPSSVAQKPELQQGAINRPAKIVRQTIRSGQQIYAPGADLVVIGSVSTGAEVLADGNIHIYGTLRGRALAGVLGNQSASIFCHCLQAELSSIAGIYLLSEDLPEDKIGGSVQIYLDNEKLQIESI